MTRPNRTTLAIYLGAAVVYITVGVFFVDFMFSVIVAMGYLLVAVWLIPAALKRLR
ncbi:MAG TPA: hypothetical protein VH306_00820 [Gaiellaceae bacterium]